MHLMMASRLGRETRSRCFIRSSESTLATRAWTISGRRWLRSVRFIVGIRFEGRGPADGQVLKLRGVGGGWEGRRRGGNYARPQGQTQRIVGGEAFTYRMIWVARGTGKRIMIDPCGGRRADALHGPRAA